MCFKPATIRHKTGDVPKQEAVTMRCPECGKLITTEQMCPFCGCEVSVYIRKPVIPKPKQ